MPDYLFTVDASEKDKLIKVLEAEPYEETSFARIGYLVKDSAALSLEPGRIVLHFRCDEESAKTLIAKLREKALEKFERAITGKTLTDQQKQAILKGLEAKELKTLVELSGEEKERALAKIREEEEAALTGFGRIFG